MACQTGMADPCNVLADQPVQALTLNIVDIEFSEIHGH